MPKVLAATFGLTLLKNVGFRLVSIGISHFLVVVLFGLTGHIVLYAAIRYFNLADDESTPMAALIISGNTLYGTTESGIFAINTDGTDLIGLHGFSSFSEGALLQTSLILVGTTLYGTATEGGNYLHNQYDPGFSGFGTVFSVTLPPPQLTITLSGEYVVLSWPTNFTGYTLQSATNLIPSVFWTSVPGQNTVTDRISNLQTFYRLIKSSP